MTTSIAIVRSLDMNLRQSKYSLRYVAGPDGRRYLILGMQDTGPVELLDAGRLVGAERSRAADRPVKLLLLLLLLLLGRLLPGTERATGAVARDGREDHQDADHDARHDARQRWSLAPLDLSI